MKNKTTRVAFKTAIASPAAKCHRPGTFKNETATVAAVNTSSAVRTAICVRGKMTLADIGDSQLARVRFIDASSGCPQNGARARTTGPRIKANPMPPIPLTKMSLSS
jgi:hypothetical protein